MLFQRDRLRPIASDADVPTSLQSDRPGFTLGSLTCLANEGHCSWRSFERRRRVEYIGKRAAVDNIAAISGQFGAT